MLRLTKDEYYMKIAELAASRGTCCRASVGAVIVKSDVIISTGYNGKARGEEHCDGGKSCLIDGHCYVALHAEENAIIAASRTGVSLEGAKIYCTHKPCDQCSRRIINAGIIEVFYLNEYQGYGTIDLEKYIKIKKMKKSKKRILL